MALLLAAGFALTACSGSGSDLVIESVLVDEEEGVGTFTASGGAVQEGLICSEGTFEGVRVDFESDSPHSIDAYRCADMSGSLWLRVELPQEDPGDVDSVESTWAVHQATGDFVGIEGSGDYQVTFEPWVETFTGELTTP